jgi:hypothetical protein
MKGIVFTEFLEMVEQKFGYDTVDLMLSENELESGGAYTAIGTYNYSEMVQLIVDLSTRTGLGIPVLLHEYGKYFFDVLLNSYPQFFQAEKEAFNFLESIERHIHVEVRKLYPDAELPSFETERIGNDTLKMIYHSERKMSAFAEGLILRTLDYYEVNCNIEKSNIAEDGSSVQFVITKQ